MERGIFNSNAARLSELQSAIKITFARRQLDDNHYQAWTEACERFHTSYDRLAFPGGLAQELDLLKRGDAAAVEMAVRYLEANPWCFRSGYIKEELLRELRKVSLTNDQTDRLRRVILERIKSGSGREFRRYCRLAKNVMNAEFVAHVDQAMKSEDENVSRRAGWVMHSLESSSAIQQVT